MSEKCPLSGGRGSIDRLPAICQQQCIDLWDRATKSQTPELDDYNALSAECAHTDVAFSHEGLQSVDDSSHRIYSIVDKCEDCQAELQENSYTFECPNN